MRGRLALPGVLAALILALVAASTAQAATTKRVLCVQKNITVLFWPHGHHAIPSIGFPQFLVPHLEVYKTANAYPNANTLAVVQANGGVGASNRCINAPKQSDKTVSHSKRITSQHAVKCKSSKLAELELVGVQNQSGTLRVFYGKTLVLVAKMLANGSTLTFDKNVCTATKSPS